MSKFKVGDKVRVTAAYGGGNGKGDGLVDDLVKVGDELTVNAVNRTYANGRPASYPVAANGWLFTEVELELVESECAACDCEFPQVYADLLVTVDFGEQGLIVLHEDEVQALIRELELVTS